MNSKANPNIMIAGVGGQGIIFASKLVARTAMNAGYHVQTAETIGMAQRGGMVVSHIRINEKSVSPIIPLGKVDALIGFELFELARNLPRLSATGRCIGNSEGMLSSQIEPVPKSLGGNVGAAQVVEHIRRISPGSLLLPCQTLLQKLKLSPRLNVFMLGLAAQQGIFPFDEEALEHTMRECMPKHVLEQNLRALHEGGKASI
ncbi:indolepyruvate oxidoreductase subunit beta [Paenibacillus sp. NPDC055715]